MNLAEIGGWMIQKLMMLNISTNFTGRPSSQNEAKGLWRSPVMWKLRRLQRRDNCDETDNSASIYATAII
jgi:hypothetical protein